MSGFKVTELPEGQLDATLPQVLGIEDSRADELCDALAEKAGDNMAVGVNSIHLITEDENERAFLYVFIGTMVGAASGPIREEVNPVDNHTGG